MPPRVINMLTAVGVEELSLCRRGMNAKRIALTKGAHMNIAELIKQVMETEAEGEKDLRAALAKSGKDEDAVEAAVAQFRLAHGFKDKLKQDDFAAVAKAAGYSVAEKADPKPDHKPKAKPKAEPDPKDDEIPDAVKKAIDAKDAEIVALKKTVEASVTSLADERAVRVRKELTHECEAAYPLVPGMTAEEQADTLIAVRKADPEAEKSLRKTWAATNEAMASSALLTQSGSPLRGSGSADEEITKLAQERAQKSDGKVSFAKAYSDICEQNPVLYKKYLDENPAQGGL